jgi:hypothetical protein
VVWDSTGAYAGHGEESAVIMTGRFGGSGVLAATRCRAEDDASTGADGLVIVAEEAAPALGYQ